MELNWASLSPEVLLEVDAKMFFPLEAESRLVLVSRDEVRVLEWGSFETLQSLTFDGSYEFAAALDPSKQHLYVTDRRRVRRFDLVHLKHGPAIEVKGEIRSLCLGTRTQRLLALSSGQIERIGLRERVPKVNKRISHHGLLPRRAALSADEATLAWMTPSEVHLYRTDPLTHQLSLKPTAVPRAVAYSPQGLLATLSWDLSGSEEEGYQHGDMHLEVWEPSKGRHLGGVALPAQLAYHLLWHPQLPVLAFADYTGQISLWRWGDGTQALTPLDTLEAKPYTSQLEDLRFSADGTRLLALTNRALLEYRLEGVTSSRQAQGAVATPVSSADLTLYSPTRMQWHGSDLYLSANRGWARLDASLKVLERHDFGDSVHQVALDPAQSRLVRVTLLPGVRGRLELCTLAGQVKQRCSVLLDLKRSDSDKDGETHDTEWIHPQDVALRFDEDGVHLEGGMGGEVLRWDLGQWGLPTRHSFGTSWITPISLNAPAGLAVSTHAFQGDQVRLWNTRTHASLMVLEAEHLGHVVGWISTLSLGKGQRLALGTSRGEVRVYDLLQRTQVLQQTRHGVVQITHLAFNPTGNLLASAAQDRTVRLFALESGEEVGVYFLESSAVQLLFSLDGTRLYSAASDGRISCWDLTGSLQWDACWATPAEPLFQSPPSIAVPPAQSRLPVPQSGHPAPSPAPETTEARYRAKATAAGLERHAARSWALYRKTPHEQMPEQWPAEVVEAYLAARRLAPAFYAHFEAHAARLGREARMRPGDLKDANRVLEKLGQGKPLPTDLLAATLIAPGLGVMYSAAEGVHEDFEVVAFKDRLLERQTSGYGDLQLIVRFEGHLAEIKVLHPLIAQIDHYEHRIYEIQRSITALHPDTLPLAERLVSQALWSASREMYDAAWDWILAHEDDR